MNRWFNVAGPCRADDHYMLPAAERLPLAPELIDQKGYFVVHAPRQTGKTTAIRALGEELTASGRYAALAFSCETASAVGEDYAQAELLMLNALRRRARLALPAELQPPPWPDAPAGEALATALEAWAVACPLPVVLFFDEIDALQGETLVSVLRQLRAGYNERPRGFPASAILCGLKDVRDYKLASGGDPARLASSSPFNIKLKSLRLGDFTVDEVRRLYHQHTSQTGQQFESDAVEYAFHLTAGQPWLVNALAREVIEDLKVPASESITLAHIDDARDRLIRERATHLDSLVSKLSEPRVVEVLVPLISGESDVGDDLEYNDDVAYLRDLGLIAPKPPVRVANPIYREILLRVMAAKAEDTVTADPAGFVDNDGTLDFERLLDKFLAWWPEHGEILSNGPYHEVAPHLVLMGFLHRIVNGGGFIDREYGVGKGRIDMLIRWPYTNADGRHHVQREAMELKVWHPGRSDPLANGLQQLDAYLDRLGMDTGTLVIFDRRPEAEPIADRTAMFATESPAGRRIRVLRC